MRPGRALVLAGAALAALLGAACGKKAGTPCKGTESMCADKKTALACRGGGLVEIACEGPLGCTKYRDRASCDTSVAAPGRPCMGEEDEYACTSNGKRALVCNKGKFDLYLECRGMDGCRMAGHTPTCDQSVADKGDPCKKSGALACASDQKQLVICKDGKFAVHRHCRGQKGCTNDGEAPSCDESLSRAGDPCGVPGQVVCSEDGKEELVCQTGVYMVSRACKAGCTVTSKPGRPIDCR
jgi:hypothetical protein